MWSLLCAIYSFTIHLNNEYICEYFSNFLRPPYMLLHSTCWLVTINRYKIESMSIPGNKFSVISMFIDIEYMFIGVEYMFIGVEYMCPLIRCKMAWTTCCMLHVACVL